MMMPLETVPFDAARFLETQEDVIRYLELALEEGDAALFQKALGDVARSQGMGPIAEAAGVNRTALYKALSAEGDPRLSTLMAVLRALGLRLSLQSAA
ncbi:addiction module antidote protein [Phreatobacter sp.]|uniref:addiction module antidote protein n=1 Tax=Phreatobacter sp. TaxID=1966341 RepID=UPI003F70F294